MARRFLLAAMALTAATSTLLPVSAQAAVGPVPHGTAGQDGTAGQHGAAGQDDFVLSLASPRVSGVLQNRATVRRSLINAAGQSQWIACKGPTASPVPVAPGPADPEPNPAVPNPAVPTVVLVAGLGADHSYWARVRPLLTSSARVCWYDRPGLGYSAPRVGSRKVRTATQARELAALLAAAGEKGPFVVAGHSYGGLLVRSFARQFPSLTAGVVLVDASYSTQWRYSGKYWSEAGARINMLRTERDVYGYPRLGRKPLIVLGAGRGNSRQWQSMQAVAAKLSKNSVHVTVRNATHVIMTTHPTIVATAIGQVTAAATGHSALVGCAKNVRTVWGPQGGFCGPRK